MAGLSETIGEFLGKYADKFAVVWLPVEPDAEHQNSVVTDLVKLVVEDVLFAPMKIYTLSRVFGYKSRLAPGIFIRLYISVVHLIFIVPLLLLQGTMWQAWRLLKNVVNVLLRRTTFINKKEVFPTAD